MNFREGAALPTANLLTCWGFLSFSQRASCRAAPSLLYPPRACLSKSLSLPLRCPDTTLPLGRLTGQLSRAKRHSCYHGRNLNGDFPIT